MLEALLLMLVMPEHTIKNLPVAYQENQALLCSLVKKRSKEIMMSRNSSTPYYQVRGMYGRLWYDIIDLAYTYPKVTDPIQKFLVRDQFSMEIYLACMRS